MIERNINETLLNAEPSSKALVDMLLNIDESRSIGTSAIYHHFPLYPTSDGDKAITANILLCTQKYGVFIFKCIDYSQRIEISKEKILTELDEIDRLIYAKLLKDAPNLRSGRRELKVKIKPIIFLNNYHDGNEVEFDDFSIAKSAIDIDALIRYEPNDLAEIDYNDLKATIEGSKGIPRPVERNIKNTQEKKSKGAILTTIENQICNFDLEQKRAALFTLDGAQRIRGLAGSGKTIILAMKAAMIHLQNSDVEILYTYYTKSLHDVVKRLITRFYRQFADKDPNWEKIHIMHAWGGKNLEGVYYNACNSNNILPMDLATAKMQSKKDPFDFVCEMLNKENLEPYYDYSLLDEAQDFPSSFYRLCRQLTKNNKVVWAYDDFQNILHVNLQSEKETFGRDSSGNWIIDFNKRDDELQDLVLHKCYRNPRKILTTAFALGLGIYNKDDKLGKIQIIQKLESNDHWQSLGFKVDSGNSLPGDDMIISRPSENSPLLKNEYLDNENDIIKILSFTGIKEECEAVVNLIEEDLNDELNPEDISVICLDNRNAKSYFQVISILLAKKGFKTFNLLTVPPNNIVYKVSGRITLSTIYKAKGNEAGCVYIIGTDTVFSLQNRNDITERNKLFTAITRAQGWVTITGTGIESMNQCRREFEALKSNGFALRFKQPSDHEVMTIRQDINKKQAALNKIERMAEELSKELGISKDVIAEDIKMKLLDKK